MAMVNRFDIAEKIWYFRELLMDKFEWDVWAGLRSPPNFVCEMLDRVAAYLYYGASHFD